VFHSNGPPIGRDAGGEVEASRDIGTKLELLLSILITQKKVSYFYRPM